MVEFDEFTVPTKVTDCYLNKISTFCTILLSVILCDVGVCLGVIIYFVETETNNMIPPSNNLLFYFILWNYT